MKELDKVMSPKDNIALVALGTEEAGNYIPFTLLDDILLNLSHSSATMM